MCPGRDKAREGGARLVGLRLQRWMAPIAMAARPVARERRAIFSTSWPFELTDPAALFSSPAIRSGLDPQR
tara:strand:- start:57 stop:269 length:213 start_codon:yes stop_codon:yes gene_type:complete